MARKRPTIVTLAVFQSLYQSGGANTNQARAVRAEQIQPFVQWATKQGLTRRTVPAWNEALETFSRLPA